MGVHSFALVQDFIDVVGEENAETSGEGGGFHDPDILFAFKGNFEFSFLKWENVSGGCDVEILLGIFLCHSLHVGGKFVFSSDLI